VGCGAVRAKHDLLRLALDGQTVVADRAARRPGRGAYVCGAPCLERAVQRRALARAFRQTVSVPPELVESITSG
jgi:predicted RNA-binding protein YlxR (DUF448 family)